MVFCRYTILLASVYVRIIDICRIPTFSKSAKGEKRKQQKRGKRGGVAIEMAKRLLPASTPKGGKREMAVCCVAAAEEEKAIN